ncbi:MAG: hypothetical protein EOO13_09395 [Chitinophagaceae bacterium]|nr:MAG: hypothetical protein EOO13_09395 [Chitinophagaceae bacterium]
MSKQNYQNHKRYYPAHHFIFLPLVGFATGFGFYKAGSDESNSLTWLLFGIASFFILYLAIMLRQHYALNNQNRIVRLEFRLRYFELTGHSSLVVEKQLNFGQIAALRFANDIEFKILLDRAIAENLSADDIKRSIKDWQADDMRV